MIKDLQKILLQVHSPNEYQLSEVSIDHPLYWTWSITNAKKRDLDLKTNKEIPDIAGNMGYPPKFEPSSE